MSNIELKALRQMESKLQKKRDHLENIINSDFLSQVINGDQKVIDECKKHEPKEALEIIRKWELKRKELLKKADFQTNNIIDYTNQLCQLRFDLETIKRQIYFIEMKGV